MNEFSQVNDNVVNLFNGIDLNTKWGGEDLHKELHAMTWKIFGGCALLAATVYFIARHVG
jgi:hypothetical protein